MLDTKQIVFSMFFTESVDMAVVSPAADGVVGHSLHASASNHFNLNNNYQLEPHVHTHESLEHIPQVCLWTSLNFLIIQFCEYV